MSRQRRQWGSSCKTLSLSRLTCGRVLEEAYVLLPLENLLYLIPGTHLLSVDLFRCAFPIAKAVVNRSAVAVRILEEEACLGSCCWQ